MSAQVGADALLQGTPRERIVEQKWINPTPAAITTVVPSLSDPSLYRYDADSFPANPDTPADISWNAVIPGNGSSIIGATVQMKLHVITQQRIDTGAFSNVAFPLTRGAMGGQAVIERNFLRLMRWDRRAVTLPFAPPQAAAGTDMEQAQLPFSCQSSYGWIQAGTTNIGNSCLPQSGDYNLGGITEPLLVAAINQTAAYDPANQPLQYNGHLLGYPILKNFCIGPRTSPIWGAASRTELTVNGSPLNPDPMTVAIKELTLDSDRRVGWYQDNVCEPSLSLFSGKSKGFMFVRGEYYGSITAPPARPAAAGSVVQNISFLYTADTSAFDPFVNHHGTFSSQLDFGHGTSREYTGSCENVQVILTACYNLGNTVLQPTPDTQQTVCFEYDVLLTQSVPYPPFASWDQCDPSSNPAAPPISRISLTLQNWNPQRVFQVGHPMAAFNLPTIHRDWFTMSVAVLEKPVFTLQTQTPPMGVQRPLQCVFPWALTRSVPVALLGGLNVMSINTDNGGTGVLTQFSIGGCQVSYTSSLDWNVTVQSVTPLTTAAITTDTIADVTLMGICPAQNLSCTAYTSDPNMAGTNAALNQSLLNYIPIRSAVIRFNNSSNRGATMTPDMWYQLMKSQFPLLSRQEWDSGCYPLSLPSSFMCSGATGQSFPGPNTTGGPMVAELYIGIPEEIWAAYSQPAYNAGPGAGTPVTVFERFCFINGAPPTVRPLPFSFHVTSWTMTFVVTTPTSMAIAANTYATASMFSMAPFITDDGIPHHRKINNSAVPMMRGGGFGSLGQLWRGAKASLGATLSDPKTKERIANMAKGAAQHAAGWLGRKLQGKGDVAADDADAADDTEVDSV